MKLAVLWRNLGNSMVYYPRLAKATGGVTASVFFYQLFQRQSQLSHPDEWIRITFDEIEDETGLSQTEQKLARIQLTKRLLLKERQIIGDDNTIEVWVDVEALEKRLEDIWQEVQSPLSPAIKDESVLQQASSEQLSLRNSQEDLHSDTVKAVTVNGEVSTQLERTKLTKNKDTSSSKDGLSSIEKPLTALGALPTPKVSALPTPQVKSAYLENRIQLLPGQRQPIVTKVTPNYQFNGPWESPEQFENFQRALLEYFKEQGVPNPAGWVFRIIDGITKGLVSPFWDEFITGIPLGESQKVKRDWEIEAGVPYPAFEEERTQYYLHKGEPLEAAVAKARSDLRDPVLGKDLWAGFLRKCDRIADEAIKAKNQGVQTPYLPPSFSNKSQITKQSVMTKLTTVNPQFFLTSSSIESLSDASLEQPEVSSKSLEPVDIPSILSLQEVHNSPMGRTLVEKQIAAHPEWGYKIVDGQVIDSMPF